MYNSIKNKFLKEASTSTLIFALIFALVFSGITSVFLYKVGFPKLAEKAAVQSAAAETTLRLQVGVGTDNAWWHGSVDGLDTCNSVDISHIANNAAGKDGGGPASKRAMATATRFTNVTIPKNATIASTTWQGYELNGGAGPVPAFVWGEAADSAVTFDGTCADWDGRATTSAFVAWTITVTGGNGWQSSPDLKTIIQEIVNRDGWASGNDLVISVRKDQAAAEGLRQYWRTYDFDSTIAFKLHIAYSTGPSTELGDGTDPTASPTLAPGAASTTVDAFTLKTSSSTDTVTSVTTTFAGGTSAGVATATILSADGGTIYGSITNPASDVVAISLSTNISVTTATSSYILKITPKTHANMPAVPGASYALTATITGYEVTSSNSKTGTDTDSDTVTIDNLSPNNVTATSTAPESQQVTVSWTNPGGDFDSVVILRKSSSTITDNPVEGDPYSVNDTIGASTVRYVSNGVSFIDTGLDNGTTYYYKIFAKDTRGNYAVGTEGSATANPPAIKQMHYRWRKDDG